MEWDDYEVYDPGVDRPPEELSKGEARAAFERLMAAKAERVALLSRLLEENGVQIDTSNRGIQALNDWFRRALEPEPSDPGAPRKIWFSIMNDIALFLGDAMIERSLDLEWRLFEGGRKNAAYHQPVIMGFDVPNPRYNVDLRSALSTYAHRILANEAGDERDLFVRMVDWAESHARNIQASSPDS